MNSDKKQLVDLLQADVSTMSAEDRRALLVKLETLHKEEEAHQQLVARVELLARHYTDGGFLDASEMQEMRVLLTLPSLTREDLAPLTKTYEAIEAQARAELKRVQELKDAVAAALTPMRQILDTEHGPAYVEYAMSWNTQGQVLSGWAQIIFGYLADLEVTTDDYFAHVLPTLRHYEQSAVEGRRADCAGYANALGQTLKFNAARLKSSVQDYRASTEGDRRKAAAEEARVNAVYLANRKNAADAQLGDKASEEAWQKLQEVEKEREKALQEKARRTGQAGSGTPGSGF